jgi:magnesium transporter
MIRSLLISINHEVQEGSRELVETWREQTDSFLWLDYQKTLDEADIDLLQSLGCHVLAIKDAVRKSHPPKVEYFTDNTFVLFRGITAIDENLRLSPQQIAFFIGERLLITTHTGLSLSIEHYFSEQRDASLICNPLMQASSIMHYSSGRYLETILGFEDQLTEAEDTMMNGGSDALMKELVGYRSQLRKLKRVFSYHEKLACTLLEMTGKSNRTESESLQHAMRDLFDRCERLHSLSGMYYEICGDLIDGYISITSHQLNNTMKILTIITAIFVPLSFLAGLYGMNFDNIPELHNQYGYFILLGIMAAVACSMVYFFKRYKWF